MTRVSDEPGVVLHTRPYRENSLMVSVLTLRHGRVTLIARGVRGNRRGRAIQTFSTANFGWSGRSSLATLTGCEPVTSHWFTGNVLASSFYLTELIMRLVGEREPHPRLYAGLEWALNNVDSQTSLALRSFEKLLLEDLGYGLDFQLDVDGEPVQSDRSYRLLADRGFVPASDGLSGEMIIRIGEEAFHLPTVRRAAQGLFREALAHHLGPRPLMSRRLLVGRS